MPLIDLPLLQGEPHERSDAARNRRKVLEAASRLFECRGVANVSMEAVAAEAGVGKGTLFRRFGDRASLARSVLEAHEIQLQEALIRGPAPLGPGAPGCERLIAFGHAYLDFLEERSELILAAEFGAALARMASPVYNFYRMHIAILLRDAGVEDNVEYLADVLFAPLSASMFMHHRQARGLSLEQLKDAYAKLCTRVLDSQR
jgi:AcrR family transcriptional regulator